MIDRLRVESRVSIFAGTIQTRGTGEDRFVSPSTQDFRCASLTPVEDFSFSQNFVKNGEFPARWANCQVECGLVSYPNLVMVSYDTCVASIDLLLPVSFDQIRTSDWVMLGSGC